MSAVVLPEFEASLEMTRQAMIHLRIPPTEIQRYTDTIRQESYAHLFTGNTDYATLSHLRAAEQHFDLQWFHLSPQSAIANHTIGESEIRKKTGASIVGVVRDKRLRPNPDADFVLLPHDLIAIIGSKKNRQAFCLLASTDPDLPGGMLTNPCSFVEKG